MKNNKIIYFLLAWLVVVSCFIGKDVLARESAYVTIDEPRESTTVTDLLHIRGWTLSDLSNTKVRVKIGSFSKILEREYRPDVLNAYKDYNDSNNEKPGYDDYINLSDIEDLGYGKQKVIIELLDSSEQRVIKSNTVTFNREAPKTEINLGYPSVNGNYVDNLHIKGWAMSSRMDTKVKVFIDNEEITDIKRVERADVISAVQGYGTIKENPLPGFERELDISDLSYGSHTIKIQVVDSKNEKIVLKENTRKFNRVKAIAEINLGDPFVDQNVSDNLHIRGWAMSSGMNTSVKVFVDNKEVPDVSRELRGDVISAVQGYGTIKENPMPGFVTDFDISDLPYGNHTVKIQVVDRNNNVLKEHSRNFKKGKPGAQISIESPIVDESLSDNLYIKGWVMSSAMANSLKIYVDDIEVTSISRGYRQDVFDAIKGYGTVVENPNPGYSASFDITKLSYGSHTITFKILDKNGNVIMEANRKFRRDLPKSEINLGYPAVDENDVDNLYIKGWAMSSTSNTELRVLIDNKNITGVERVARADVISAIKGYGTIIENPLPGFEKELDITYLSYGSHTIKIQVLKDGVLLREVSRRFYREKPKTEINLGYPSVNGDYVDSIYIKGWAMSSRMNTKVKVFIDKNEITDIERVARGDVISAIKGYGTIIENPLPGFEKEYDISNLSYGSHTIKIQVVDNEGNLLKEDTRKFNRKRPSVLTAIDTPRDGDKITKDLNIQGWVMSTSKNVKAYVLCNGVMLGEVTRDIRRSDVLNAIKGYGTSVENPTPGYRADFDLSKYNIKDGNVTLTLLVKDDKGITITEQNINVQLNKYDAEINIDKPSNNSSVKDNLYVEGSVKTIAPNISVKGYFDGKLIGTATGNNYSFNYNVSDIKDGDRVLRIDLLSNDEVIKTKSITVNVNKGYKGDIAIDYIDYNSSDDNKNVSYQESLLLKNDGELKLKGWAITDDSKSNQKVKVFVDEVERGEVSRHPRDDVSNSIKGYGDKSINPTPGYFASVKNLNDGNHVVSVRVYNHLDEEVHRKEFRVQIYSRMKAGIDVSEHNGNIDWGKVKRNGVEFAMIRAGYRGYENGAFKEDQRFRENVREAKAVGLEVGVYFFSQAKNYNEGVEEARKVNDYLNLLGIYLDYMPAIDVERSTCGGGTCGRADHISASERVNATRGFVDGCHSVGRRAMVYTFASWLTGGEGVNLNNANPDEVWVAQWPQANIDSGNLVVQKSSYTGIHTMWQYTDNGHIDGINGPVDMNLKYN